jgi:signal transduction histidine kinase/ligand-binding sensor domain-containing protein/DNA-binding response OmpR family regulator
MVKRLIQSIFIILPILICHLKLTAQKSNMAFDRITVEQGLTSNRINGIIQDKSGFLWLATNNGLNRFDGMEIKHYTKQQNDTTSLSNNSILSVYSDQQNVLWILTINYLHRYNQKSDNFERFLLSEMKESYRGENKGVMLSDNSGKLWIGTPTHGLFTFDKTNNTCQKVLPEINSVSDLYDDKAGNLWIGSENGLLIRYNYQSKSSKQFIIPSGSGRYVQDNFIWKIWQTSSEKLNLLLFNGLYQFNINTEKFSEATDWNEKVNYTENELRTLYHDQKELWVGTQGGGFYRIDLEKGTSDHFQTSLQKPNSLSNNSVTTILKDHSGVYWIATKDGLNKYDPSVELFNHYQNEPGNPNSLQYNFVSSFCEGTDGTIYVGTFGKGFSLFNHRTEIFQTVSRTTYQPQSLVNNVIRALETDKNGNIWIGTVKGISLFNPKTKSYVNFNSTGEKGSLLNDNIMSIHQSKDNQIYIGTYGNGVVTCDPDKIMSDGFRKLENQSENLGASRVRRISELINGTKVFGTLGNGLYFWKQKTDMNVLLSEFSKSVDSDYINAISEDLDKNIWVGTWDGLFLLDSAYTVQKQFNTSNGLPSNEITGIITDNMNNIWVSGMNGLSHLSKDSGIEYKITNFTSRNGLQGSYFTAYATLKTSDGELYFGGFNGFNRFYPETIKSGQKAPEVKITDFQVFNQSVKINQKVNGRVLLSENILDTKSITINDQHRVIGFGYTALATSQTEKVKFACRMEGIDPDWVIQNYNQRYISYNNLDPGDYKFTVKACNADGVWNEKGTSILIKVLPPFWKTWWAYGFYFIFIAALLYLAREYSLSRERLETKALLERVHREKDAEINNLKIKFFINISHEIRTPLSLIVAPLEKLLHAESLNPYIKKHLDTMYGNAQRLLSLINQLLDFRKIETGNVHLHAAPYDMVEFVSEIKNAFAESAARKEITLTLKSNIKALPIWFDPDSMEKIMFNLLSNAIKFTLHGGSIHLIVNHLPDEKHCEILVRDSGIGVPADKLEKLFDRFYQVDTKSFLKHDSVGSGIGLSIVKSLVELHMGEITVESKEGEYTQFRMVFATGKKHLERNDSITISEESLTHSFNLRSVAPIPEIENQDIADSETDHKKKKEIKILIVEDNPEISYYLKESLKSDYETLIALNGKTGCELARLNIPDLIITDVMMPEMDGIELCKTLKNEQLTQHIPIIILSAKSTIEDTLEGLETGADDYIPKPFNEQILLAKIKTLIANRQKLIEKYRFDPLKSEHEEEPDALSFDDAFVNRVVEFINENISDETLTNEKIEAHFKTNKMQLYRKLKAVTGWSVNSLIREIRIREALKLLKHSEKNISEIAYQVGFSDPLYFSKYFKKEVGVAPQHYRKEYE